MAEAKPTDPTRESSPKLVAVPEHPESKRPVPPPGRPQPRRELDRRGVSWGAFGLAVALLVLAVAGLVVQTQRVQNQAEQIGVLDGQVEGLQVQLSAANTQLATYDMQLALVRTSVAGVFEELTDLYELVNANPFGAEPSPKPIAR